MWEEMPCRASCSPGLICVSATQAHSHTSSAASAKHGGPKAEVLAANPGDVSRAVREYRRRPAIGLAKPTCCPLSTITPKRKLKKMLLSTKQNWLEL